MDSLIEHQALVFMPTNKKGFNNVSFTFEAAKLSVCLIWLKVADIISGLLVICILRVLSVIYFFI